MFAALVILLSLLSSARCQTEGSESHTPNGTENPIDALLTTNRPGFMQNATSLQNETENEGSTENVSPSNFQPTSTIGPEMTTMINGSDAINTSSYMNVSSHQSTTGGVENKTVTPSTPLETPSRPTDLDENSIWNHTSFQLGPYCSCDLTPDVCDVNCCCDTNCTVDDLKAFSECIKVNLANVNPRYCFQTDLLYANNSQLKQVSSNDMLCLLIDNLPEHYQFLDRAPIDNVTVFTELKSRHSRYVRHPQDDLSTTFDDKMYKAGRPIWTLREKTGELGLLSLPSPLNSLECTSFSPVRFMEEEENRRLCKVSLRNVADCSQMAELDANWLVRGFAVVRSPAVDNKTDGSLPVVPVNVQLCKKQRDRDMADCSSGEEVPKPTSDCRNVLSELRYEIHHNGSKGIDKVVAIVELADYRVGGGSIIQKFSYGHIWSDSDNQTRRQQQRSGNPGYLRGKPLITALMDPITAGATVQSGNNAGISLMPLSADGSCFPNDPLPRKPVLFGQNVRIGCSFELTRDNLANKCGALKRNLTSLLVGSRGVERLQWVRVGSFGNTGLDGIEGGGGGDWVPLMVENPPGQGPTDDSSTKGGTCDNVVLSLHVEILFSQVGALANPQAKIIGVRYQFGQPTDLRFRCLSVGSSCLTQRAELTTSVSFVDVTRPAVERHAEFPIIEVKFPHDFFYPFVTAFSAAGSSNYVAKTSVVIVCLLAHIRNFFKV